MSILNLIQNGLLLTFGGGGGGGGGVGGEDEELGRFHSNTWNILMLKRVPSTEILRKQLEQALRVVCECR